MITYDDLRNTLYKDWTARVWIDGTPYTVVGGLPTRSLSSLRPRSTCNVELQTLPPSTLDLSAIVEIVMNGKTETFFTGKTAQRSATSDSYTRTINLIDLITLDYGVPADITWSNRSFVAAVTDILTAAGLDATMIDHIFDPGSGYVLAPNYSVTVKKGEAIGQVLGEMMDYGGTAFYTTASGKIRVVDNPGIPASTSAILYANGADLGAGEFGIFNSGVSLEGNETATASFRAYGPKRPDGNVPDGTYTATGVRGKADSKQYRWLQTDTLAQTIATRELGRRARARVNVWFEAPLNPILSPGDSIFFRDSNIGLPTNAQAFVVEVSTTAEASMRVQIALGASLVDGYATSIVPPRVDFSMTVENQQIVVAGAPASQFFVQCRNASKDPNGYRITSLAWTAVGTGVVPAVSYTGIVPNPQLTWTWLSRTTDPPPTADAIAKNNADFAAIGSPLFFFESLTDATVKLTVGSESGESASLTKTPLALDTQTFTRIVTQAGESGWGVLSKTGWRYFTVDGAVCTAVPPINETGPMYAGWDSGAIYTSADLLATTPTLCVTLAGGSIGCLWVNETTISNVLAGNGTLLSVSNDSGVTWATLHDFGAAVVDVQNSPSNPNEIRVCAGTTQYITYNGTTWTALTVGPTDSFAKMGAYAPWGHAVAFDGVTSEADSLHFEEGYAVDWTPITEADRPTGGLLSVTPLITEPGYIAGAGAITDLVRDGTLDALVFGASGGGGNIYKLLWNGSWFVASLLLSSMDRGPIKLLNQAHTYPIDLLSASQVGYGPLATPPVGANILLPTWGASPGGVYRFDVTTRTWTLLNSGLPSGWLWQCVAVDPWNTAHWILLGSQYGMCTSVGGHIVGDSYWLPNQYWWDGTTGGTYSAFWETTDAGATWSSLAVSDVAPVTNVVTGYGHVVGSYKGTLSNLTFSTSTPGAWAAVTCESPYADGKRIIRAGAAELISDAGDAPTTPSYGINGDVVFTTRNFWSTASLRVAPAAATAITTAPGDGSFYGVPASIVVYPLSRMALVVANGSIFGTSDYRAAQPVMRAGGGAWGGGAWGVLTLTDDNRLYATQGYSIYEILDIFGTPTTRTAYTASVGIDSLIAMGQIIAGRLSATTTYVVSTDGGDTWAEIAGPVGIDPSTLSALAIVNSEVTP